MCKERDDINLGAMWQHPQTVGLYFSQRGTMNSLRSMPERLCSLWGGVLLGTQVLRGGFSWEVPLGSWGGG